MEAKVLRGGVDEGQEAKVGGCEGDEEKGPQEPGAYRREAPMELSVHRVGPDDLHLPGR